ncbi:50S ribosomal protein L16 [Thermoproteota archaeon]
MARIRKFCAYRRIERPYTRISKFRKKSYVRTRPNSKIVRYHMGDLKSEFDSSVLLQSKVNLQVRDGALEAARQTSNRYIQKKLGKIGWRIVIRCYPHHILRENPLAAGAGADRMSTGMKRSFGKSIGIAAQIKRGQIVFQIDVNKNDIPVAKEAIRRAQQKLPCTCAVVTVDHNAKPKATPVKKVVEASKKEVKPAEPVVEKPVEAKPIEPVVEKPAEPVQEEVKVEEPVVAAEN